MAHLVGVWRAHKDNRTILRHLPATPGVHFAEEELHQNRKCPEKGVVNVFVHLRNGLLALLLVRHIGSAASRLCSKKRLWYVYGGRDTWVAIVWGDVTGSLRNALEYRSGRAEEQWRRRCTPAGLAHVSDLLFPSRQ